MESSVIIVMLCISCCWASAPIEGDPTSSGEKRLLETLLRKYKPTGQNARPVYNASKPVKVDFGLGLIQMELNEKDNILSLSTWTRYAWNDEFLQWNPMDYDNVTSIRFHREDIWTPDIMLYNTANVERESREALLVVSADGNVKWFPHSIFRSTCAFDVANYPFDIQECNLWFGSWTYPSHEVDLQMSVPGGIDLSTFQADYKKSSKWEVANLTAQRRLLPSEEDFPNFVVLTFKLYLKRRMVFSTYMLTLPCVFLACLTLVVFWLPPERPDRTALAMNAFASFMVLLLILVEAAMPTASSVPTLGVYYCFNLVIIMVSIVLSSLVVNISRGQPGKRVPVWLYFMVVQVLARLICFHRVAKELEQLMEEYTDANKIPETEGSRQKRRFLFCCKDKKADKVEEDLVEQLNSHFQRDKSINSVPSAGLLEQQVKELRRCMERFEAKADERVKNRKREFLFGLEWRTVGIILDRFFFYIYIGLIGISLAVFFPRPLEPQDD